MIVRHTLFVATFVSFFPLAVAAADTKPGTAKPAEAKAVQAKPAETADDDVGHHGQFNTRFEFNGGYHMLFRYSSSPRCAPIDTTKRATDQQKFCGFGAAPGIGVALGYSAIDFFEPFVFARFGLSDEVERTNQGKLVQVGAGARLYTMSDSRFKIFFAPFIGLDLTGGPVQTPDPGVEPGAYRTDLLAHLDIGPQYDFSRYVGAYLSGGLTFQMLRYLGATAELSIGLQLRAP